MQRQVQLGLATGAVLATMMFGQQLVQADEFVVPDVAVTSAADETTTYEAVSSNPPYVVDSSAVSSNPPYVASSSAVTSNPPYVVPPVISDIKPYDPVLHPVPHSGMPSSVSDSSSSSAAEPSSSVSSSHASSSHASSSAVVPSSYVSEILPSSNQTHSEASTSASSETTSSHASVNSVASQQVTAITVANSTASLSVVAEGRTAPVQAQTPLTSAPIVGHALAETQADETESATSEVKMMTMGDATGLGDDHSFWAPLVSSILGAATAVAVILSSLIHHRQIKLESKYKNKTK